MIKRGSIIKVGVNYYCMLCQVSDDEFALVCIDDGNRYSDAQMCKTNEEVVVAGDYGIYINEYDVTKLCCGTEWELVTTTLEVSIFE